MVERTVLVAPRESDDENRADDVGEEVEAADESSTVGKMAKEVDSRLDKDKNASGGSRVRSAAT